MSDTPKSWKDLNKDELIAAADYFGSESKGTKEVILANLAADGVTWEDYLDAFHPDTNEDEPAPVQNEPEFVEEEEEELTELVTKPKHEALAPTSKYLIKMDRENPYFEWGKYKFTQERPFAVMPAADAQAILTSEEGFRQAFPDEVDEYYN